MLISKKDKYLSKKDSFICVHNTIYQINCYISSQIKETMNIHIDNNFDTRYYLTEIDKTPTSIFCYHKEISEVYVVEHKHNKAQFLYCEGGIVYVKIGKDTFYLPARHYMWIPPHTEHSIHPNTPEVILRNLYFPINEGDHAFYKKVGIYPADGLLLELLLFSNQWKGDISPENRSEYIIAQAFKEILPKVSKASLRLALPLPHDERLKKIVQFLDDNMDSSITMKKITAEFGFSERSLSRLFQKDLAMTFVQYFTILRMLRALQLLIDGSYSISEISNMVGYNSLPTFSNTFQKVIGVRPTDYSKKKDIL